MTKVAVVLSGCGYLDGAEIREAVIALWALDKMDASVRCFAPDIDQHDVVNHLTGQQVDETRNVLVESARIARGQVTDLKKANADDFDALVLPGGFGAAKNLSNIAFKGIDGEVLPEFKDFIVGFLKAGKPIGAICISPAVLVAAVKGEASPIVTLGEDKEGLIIGLGGKHESCATHNCMEDNDNNIVSCSAYMQEAPLAAVAGGIEKLVENVIARAQSKQGKVA